MKINKELLIKHHFWALLAAFVALIGTGFGMAWLGAFGTADAKKTDYESKKTALDTYKNGKIVNTTTFIRPWDDYKTYHSDHKEKVWKMAWDAQKDLVRWPRDNDNFHFQRTWNTTTSLKEWKSEVLKNDQELTRALNQYKRLYGTQFDKLDELVAPAEFKNGKAGFEQMMLPPGPGGGEAAGIMAPPPGGPIRGPGPGALGKGPKGVFNETPTLEEVWLAQEDFWIKREILQTIYKTLRGLAEMKEEKVKADEKIGFEHKRFRNNDWEVDLVFEKVGATTYLSSKGTIRNVDPGKRIMYLANPRTHGGIEFVLLQDGVDPYVMEIKGEPLVHNAKTAFNFKVEGGLPGRQITNLDPTKSFKVEQVYDWANCPIRRIDEIRLGAHSHRTSIVPALKPNPNFATPKKAGPPGTAPGAPPGGQPGGTPPGPGAAPPKDEAADPFTEANRLLRQRYLNANLDQCRQIPIGIVLVLEQDHIHDILAELTSCMLRFQITQWQVAHVRNVQSQAPPVAGAAANPMGPRPMGPMGQMMGSNEPDPNLVELCVYGVASLYERYPEKKGSPTTPKETNPPKGTNPPKETNPKGTTPKDPNPPKETNPPKGTPPPKETNPPKEANPPKGPAAPASGPAKP